MIASKKNWCAGLTLLTLGTALTIWAATQGLQAMLRPQDRDVAAPVIAEGLAGIAVVVVGFTQMVASTQEEANTDERLETGVRTETACSWCGQPLAEGERFCRTCENRLG